MKLKCKIVVQNSDEQGEEYGVRLQEIMDSIYHKAKDGFQPSNMELQQTASSDGRLTTLITWID